MKEADWNVGIEQVLSVLKADPLSNQGGLRDRILHSIIDGPIDADKIDYLKRDSQVLWLPYGKGIDLRRLLTCLTIIARPEGNGTFASIGIHEKGKVPAEAVAFARYALFGQVYWQHTFRALKAMIRALVWEALQNQVNDSRRTDLRNEFREYVTRLAEIEPAQGSLLSNLERRSEDNGNLMKNIHPTDYAVIRWLAQRGGDRAARLAGYLLERDLTYKRLLVLTRARARDWSLWESLASYQRRNRGHWEPMRSLNVEFQEEVREIVGNQSEAEPESRVRELGQSFVRRSGEEQLLLVDVPHDKHGGLGPLEYLVESDRLALKRDEQEDEWEHHDWAGGLRSESLERSLIWEAVHKNFMEALGKVRVFCHPDFVGFLRAQLTRQELEDVLRRTVRRLERGKSVKQAQRNGSARPRPRT